MTRVLQEHGLQTLLFNAAPPQTVDDLIPLVLQYRVKGVIITTAVLSSSGAEMCRNSGIPVVLFNRATRTGGVHSVSCDNVEGGRTAADILLQGGARKMVYIGGMENASTSRDRKKGFSDRLNEWDVTLLGSVEKEFTYEWGYAATLDLMKRHPDIDGVFCADDEIATGAIDAIRYALGKAVPDDIQVLGFDDHPTASRAAYQLSTIRQPVEEMITHALDLLRNHSSSPTQVRLCRCQPVLRISAGCPKQNPRE
jgi:DNA-binding LacI/PurR family transcriptional regulator